MIPLDIRTCETIIISSKGHLGPVWKEARASLEALVRDEAEGYVLTNMRIRETITSGIVNGHDLAIVPDGVAYVFEGSATKTSS